MQRAKIQRYALVVLAVLGAASMFPSAAHHTEPIRVLTSRLPWPPRAARRFASFRIER